MNRIQWGKFSEIKIIFEIINVRVRLNILTLKEFNRFDNIKMKKLLVFFRPYGCFDGICPTII
jgi:hypothetical protein